MRQGERTSYAPYTDGAPTWYDNLTHAFRTAFLAVGRAQLAVTCHHTGAQTRSPATGDRHFHATVQSVLRIDLRGVPSTATQITIDGSSPTAARRCSSWRRVVAVLSSTSSRAKCALLIVAERFPPFVRLPCTLTGRQSASHYFQTQVNSIHSPDPDTSPIGW